MHYAIVTFGCRVNQADSLQIEEQLIACGGSATPASDADLVIVNTCSVTGSADQSTRQIVRKIARENPRARIVVTGCYATRAPHEVQQLSDAVQVVANDRKEWLSEDIGLSTATRFGDGEGSCGAAIVPGLAGRTAFTLRVQTGCDQTCAYCIIPKTRGRGRSRTVDDVLGEVGRAVDAGYREVAITGVHLGAYGRDLPRCSSLFELLSAIECSGYAARFRVSSLEPMDCSDEIVDLITSSSSLAPHFHLPLQHASDRVLSAMRRPYTLAYYRRLVDGIRRAMPHASIGSDVIAGFPGETAEDFDALCAYLEGSPLTHLHVFPYSDRPGTAASELGGKVHGAVVRDRASRLRQIGRDLTRRFHLSQAGTVRPALTLEDGSLAVTDNYLKVRIGAGRARNEWVSVALSLRGDLLEGAAIS